MAIAQSRFTIATSRSAFSAVPKLIPLDGEAATVEVGAVTTLPSGAPATVVNVGTPGAAIFDFGLPQGAGDMLSSQNLSSLTSTDDANENLRTFKTVSSLVSSTRAGGGVGTRWRAGEFPYSEVASDATDYDIETAGGVRLVAQPLQDGSLNVDQFGIRSAHDQNLFVKAVKRGGRKGRPVLVDPTGVKFNFSAACELNYTTLGFYYRHIFIRGAARGSAHGYSPVEVCTASGVDAFIVTEDSLGSGDDEYQENVEITDIFFSSAANDDTGFGVVYNTTGNASALYGAGPKIDGCGARNKAGLLKVDNLTSTLIGFRFLGYTSMKRCRTESTPIAFDCNMFCNHLVIDDSYFHNSRFVIGPYGGGYWGISNTIIASARPTMFDFAEGVSQRYALRVAFHNQNGESSGDSTAPQPVGDGGGGTWRRDMLMKYAGAQYAQHEFTFSGYSRITGVEEDQTTIPKMTFTNNSNLPMKVVPKGAVFTTPDTIIVQAPDIAVGTEAKHFFAYVPLDVGKHRAGYKDVAVFNQGLRAVGGAHRQIKRIKQFPGIGAYAGTEGYFFDLTGGVPNPDGKSIFAITMILEITADATYPFGVTTGITINGSDRSVGLGRVLRAGVYQCILGIVLDSPSDVLNAVSFAPTVFGSNYPVSAAVGAWYDDLQRLSDYLLPAGLAQRRSGTLATASNYDIRVPGTNTAAIVNGLSGTMRVEVNDGLLGSCKYRFEITSAGLTITALHNNPGTGITFTAPIVSARDFLNVNVANATGSSITWQAYLSYDDAAAVPYTAPVNLTATQTNDPASLAAGAVDSIQTVTLTGAALGDFIEASFSLDLQGLVLTAWVSAANTVKYQFRNPTAGVVDLSSGTVTVRKRN